jgi:hypothetical protein
LATSVGVGCGTKQGGEAAVSATGDARNGKARAGDPRRDPPAAESETASRGLRQFASPGARGQGDNSATSVVEALQHKAQEVTRQIDPASLKRTASSDASSEAPRGDWISLGHTPREADGHPATPKAHPTEVQAGAEANRSAVVTKQLIGGAAEGQGSFNTPDKVAAPITTPQEEGAGLTERLAQRARTYPLDLSAHLDYQLHRFAIGESVPDMQSLSPLPQEDRDALVAVLDGLSNFRNGVQADPNMLLSKKVQPLLDMADRIRAQAELTLPAVALCAVNTVRGFGVYEPLPPALKAGQDQPAVLYVEVGNFSSRRNEKSQLWETKLKQEAILYTEGGLAVWTDKSDIPLDTSRNRRHDFYVFKRVTLPKTLTIGRYFLKVTITDEQANRVAENSLPVQVVAQ